MSLNSGLINAKNVSLVTLLCAITAGGIYILRSQKTKDGTKIKKKRSQHNEQKMIENLQERREIILKKFEESQHRKIPQEMIETMDYISRLNADEFKPKIRLLCSQLIQDYAIMFSNVSSNKEPQIQTISMAKYWLNFKCSDTNIQVEQINHRYALSLRSRNIKEFKELLFWLQSFDEDLITKENIKENWILRNFQCSCLLGKWKNVLEFGRKLESIKPEKLATSNGEKPHAPLHPLHLFEYIALKLPNQSANFTQVYYNCEKYRKIFDPRLCPPLKFTEWIIRDCTTLLKFGFSTDHIKNNELQQQLKKNSLNNSNNNNNAVQVKSVSRYMFVYGCLVQYPCFWVQLPSSNTKMQPVVLCGPWNDTEMELTASYVRRSGNNNNNNNNNKKKNNNEEKENNNNIMVVRSDLRLHLERHEPSYKQQLLINNSNEGIENKELSLKSKTCYGWIWNGTFDYEEGLISINESQLTDFKFRRNLNWKQSADKFTCRSWNIEMIINTPG